MMTDKQTGCPIQANFDPLSPEFLADPFAVLRALPPETPVFYAPAIDYYIVTRCGSGRNIACPQRNPSCQPYQLAYQKNN